MDALTTVAAAKGLLGDAVGEGRDLERHVGKETGRDGRAVRRPVFRAQQELRDLAAGCKGTECEAVVYATAAKVLAANPQDVPFALIYRVDETTAEARLEATAHE